MPSDLFKHNKWLNDLNPAWSMLKVHSSLFDHLQVMKYSITPAWHSMALQAVRLPNLGIQIPGMDLKIWQPDLLLQTFQPFQLPNSLLTRQLQQFQTLHANPTRQLGQFTGMTALMQGSVLSWQQRAPYRPIHNFTPLFDSFKVFPAESLIPRQINLLENIQHLTQSLMPSWWGPLSEYLKDLDEKEQKVLVELLPFLEAHAKNAGWSIGVLTGNLQLEALRALLAAYQAQDYQAIEHIYIEMLRELLPEWQTMVREVLHLLMDQDTADLYADEYEECVEAFSAGRTYAPISRALTVMLEGIYTKAVTNMNLITPQDFEKIGLLYSKQTEAKKARKRIEKHLSQFTPYAGFRVASEALEAAFRKLPEKARAFLASSNGHPDTEDLPTRHHMGHGGAIRSREGLAARALLYFLDTLMLLAGAAQQQNSTATTAST